MDTLSLNTGTPSKCLTNDIASSIRLFVDDCLLYRQIDSIQDKQTLQQDLSTLFDWAKTWGMAFNVKKCNVLTITRRTKKETFLHL